MSEIIYKFPDTWELLAELDESADYEVDVTRIYRDGITFVLATASGCSCWDGDYSVESFNSLDALKESLGVNGKERDFNPSFKGVEALLKEAQETLLTLNKKNPKMN
jgi:hypothetical protein